MRAIPHIMHRLLHRWVCNAIRLDRFSLACGLFRFLFRRGLLYRHLCLFVSHCSSPLTLYLSPEAMKSITVGPNPSTTDGSPPRSVRLTCTWLTRCFARYVCASFCSCTGT